MFARVAKSGLLKATRKLSSDSNHSELESWITTYKNMRVEAKEIAESAVNTTKLDVMALRSEVSAVKSEVIQVKSEVHDLAKGQVELHKQISNLHNQGVNQTRLLLAGGTAIAGAFFAANQYVEHVKEEGRKQPVLK